MCIESCTNKSDWSISNDVEKPRSCWITISYDIKSELSKSKKKTRISILLVGRSISV